MKSVNGARGHADVAFPMLGEVVGPTEALCRGILCQALIGRNRTCVPAWIGVLMAKYGWHRADQKSLQLGREWKLSLIILHPLRGPGGVPEDCSSLFLSGVGSFGTMLFGVRLFWVNRMLCGGTGSAKTTDSLEPPGRGFTVLIREEFGRIAVCGFRWLPCN